MCQLSSLSSIYWYGPFSMCFTLPTLPSLCLLSLFLSLSLSPFTSIISAASPSLLPPSPDFLFPYLSPQPLSISPSNSTQKDSFFWFFFSFLLKSSFNFYLIFGVFSMMGKKPKPHFQFRSKIKPFVIFFIIFTFNIVDSQGDEAQAMKDLKKSLVFEKTRWVGDDYCNWNDGISCSNGKVTRIQLKDLNESVTGELPPSLNQLTALEHLEMRSTHISGPLPSLKGLSSLKVILLSANNFSSIPDDFFDGLVQLQSVALDNLPLAPGSIPSSLQSCTGLVNFSMDSSGLNGNIPDFFDGSIFTSLQSLHLTSNNLGGNLPSNLSSLTVLQSLWLNGMNLSGTIEVLQKMTGLVEVWLNKNSFTGPIPDLSDLTSLSTLNLRDNQFTGPVPESLLNLKTLKMVNLSNNLLQGPTPVFDKSVAVDMNKGSNSFCLDDPGSKCSDNVNALLSIAKDLGYPKRFGDDWEGNNPCKPWLGISCTPNGVITSINFPNFGLSGTISPDYTLLPSLQRINLANNHLYGTIPKSLEKLANLKEVDLTNNSLSGEVPALKNVVIKVDGNPDIGKHIDSPPSPGTPPGDSGGPPAEKPDSKPSKKSSFPVMAVVGSIIGVICVLVLIGLGVCLYKRKRKSGSLPSTVVIHPHHSGSDNDMVKITVAGSNVNVSAASESNSYSSSGPSDVQMVEAGNMVISIQVLRNVTNNFSEENILGRGGFGTVYKGELHDGTKIAVKRMESGVMGSKGLTEFKSEIAVLNKVRHRHLVSLIGYCLDGNERILVYEYMPQGTLSQHLFNWKEEGLKPLGWTRRLSIALDVARGVEYLHGLASQSFIHRDLKPSNILLGDDMRAKVADFGLVRLAPEGKASIETRLAGTFGYLAPEYAATGRVTTKVDIYAFGVILMELITGRKALDESQPEESMHLVTWFRRMNINKDSARKAIDPTMDADEEALASISEVGQLAGYCCSREPHQRPDMGHVVNVLSSYVERWKPADTDPEDIYAIDMDLSLAQTLKKWQAFDGDSMGGNTSSFLASSDNTQTSIPTRPPGFAESFTSADGR